MNRKRSKNQVMLAAGTKTEAAVQWLAIAGTSEYRPEDIAPTVSHGWYGTLEDMDDSVAQNVKEIYPFHDCVHSKRDIPLPKDVFYEKRPLQGGMYVSAPDTPFGIACNHVLTTQVGIEPYVEIEAHIARDTGIDPRVIQASHIKGRAGEPKDRSGQVPAKLVAALEGMHATTTLYEARELPELAKLFASRKGLLKEVQTLLRYNNALGSSLRRLDLANIRRLLRTIRSGYLGAIYGILPTIRECRGWAEEIVNYKSKKNGLRASLTLHDSKSEKLSITGLSQGSHSNVFNQSDVTFLNERWDGGMVEWIRPDATSAAYEAAVRFMARTIGLNPMALIYEVLPLSFCVDWLLSIDDLLDNLWLRNQDSYNVFYWTTKKTKYEATLRGQTGTLVIPSLGYGFEVLWLRKIKPIVQQVTYYERLATGAPSLGSSMRIRGANVYNLINAALIAIGLKW